MFSIDDRNKVYEVDGVEKLASQVAPHLHSLMAE
jgi:hypothetical protein